MGPADAAVVSGFAGGDQRAGRTALGMPRPRSRPDYRLRGLDFGIEGPSEAPTRMKRKDPSRRRRRRRLLIGWIAVLVVAALVTVLLRTSFVQPFSVPSAAMAPTLQSGDRILAVKSSLLVGPLARGDIVVFRHPKRYPCGPDADDIQNVVKRVIGLPGETIWSVGNAIDIDGRHLNEPGWYNSMYGQVGSTPIHRTKIPPGDYFLMGDNRTASCDSRSFGPIPASSIVGKVVLIVTRNGHPYIHLF